MYIFIYSFTNWNYPPPSNPVRVTTRTIPFLVGNPYKPSCVTVMGLCWAARSHKKHAKDDGIAEFFVGKNPGEKNKSSASCFKNKWTTIFLPFKSFLFLCLLGWFTMCMWIFSVVLPQPKKATSPSKCSNFPPNWLHPDPSFAVDWWPSYSPHHCEQHLMYPDESRGPRLGVEKNMQQKVSINKNNSVRYSLLGASPNENHAVLRLGHGFSVMFCGGFWNILRLTTARKWSLQGGPPTS